MKKLIKSLLLLISFTMCVIIAISSWIFPDGHNHISDLATLYLCDPIPVEIGTKKSHILSADEFSFCPEAGVLTVEQGGRLGNQMWEYASVWALAQELVAVERSLKPYIPPCIKHVLDDAFPYLSVPELQPELLYSMQMHCTLDRKPVPVHHVSRQEALHILRNKINATINIVLKKWITLPPLVIPRLQQLKIKDFVFRDELIADSRHVLSSVASNLSCKTAPRVNPSDVIYIGVHVRRTDYHNYLIKKIFENGGSSVLATASYFHKAMDYFRKQFMMCIAFIVVSDDTKWCLEHLTQNKVTLNDVFVMTRNGIDDPLSDLALLASCNHSIIDYGTFGVWGALLAGGHTLVYNLPGATSKSTNAMEVAEMMPTWKLFPP